MQGPGPSLRAMDMEAQIPSAAAAEATQPGTSVRFTVRHQTRDTLDGDVLPQTSGEGEQRAFREAGFLNCTFKVRSARMLSMPARRAAGRAAAQSAYPDLKRAMRAARARR